MHCIQNVCVYTHNVWNATLHRNVQPVYIHVHYVYKHAAYTCTQYLKC